MLVTIIATPHSAIPVVASPTVKVICKGASKTSVAAVHDTKTSLLTHCSKHAVNKFFGQARAIARACLEKLN